MSKKNVIYLSGYVVIFAVALTVGLLFNMSGGLPPPVPGSESETTLQDVFFPATEETGMFDTPKAPNTVVDTTAMITLPGVTVTDIVTPTGDAGAETAIPSETGDNTTVTVLPPDTFEEKKTIITLYRSRTGVYEEFELEEYIAGVLAAEVSYKANIEALKAQAVAARSFYLYRTEGYYSAHPQSAVCDDSSHCISFVSFNEMEEEYGQERAEKIMSVYRNAAEQCRGEYLTYMGDYVEAMCHSASQYKTESYKNVYGDDDHPYLRVTVTPENAEMSNKSFNLLEIISILFENQTIKDAAVPLGMVERYEDSGRVKSVMLFGVEFSGKQIRDSLGLSSTNYTVEYKDGCYSFVCFGKGHGIGLSQTGAYVLAEGGMSYKDILSHYYHNCQIEKAEYEKNNNSQE